jgi:NAD(P)-dependent dehydrogenase (short-subunit alcohol dehydrogenase family)
VSGLDGRVALVTGGVGGLGAAMARALAGAGAAVVVADLDGAMGANLDGVVFGTHAALPALRARGGGAIVATASLAGLTGVPSDPLYTANKHAVVGFTRAMGPALAADGIRFNALCPGWTESAIVAPIREALVAAGQPIMEPGEVAAALLRLLEAGVTGECWYVQAGRAPEAFAFRGVPGPRS